MDRTNMLTNRKRESGRRMLCPCGDLGRRVLLHDTVLYNAEAFFDPSDEAASVEECMALAQDGGCAVRIFSRAAGEQIALFRVLYRAAAAYKITVIIPEVLLPSEVEHVREWAGSAREALQSEGLPCGHITAGIAVETPSAAILADLLAPMVDFFVIEADSLMEKLHVHVPDSEREMPESVRRCVRMTCAAARREGIPVLSEQ